MIEDIFGEQVHQLVSVKLKNLLAAVPLRVPMCAVEHRAFLIRGAVIWAHHTWGFLAIARKKELSR